MVFFILFIFLLELPLAYSQQFEIAEEYFAKEDLDNALLEYERVFYFSQDAVVQKQALKHKAHIYKIKEDYLKSAYTLQRIPLYDMSLEERDSVFYQMLLCFYFADDFSKARQTMLSMDLNLQENPSKDLLLVEILNLNELKDYATAYNKLLEYENKVTYLTNEDKHLLDSLYTHQPKQKSEKKARHLSFFPGLGHVYSGYWFEGITAFVINAGVLTFGIYQAWHKDYLTAWIGGAGILAAAYTGQQKRAVYLATKYNYLKTKDFNAKIKNILLNF